MIDVLPRAVQLSLGHTSTLPARPSASRRLKPPASSPTDVTKAPPSLENQGLRLTAGDLRPKSDSDQNRQLTDEWCAHKDGRNTDVNLSAKIASLEPWECSQSESRHWFFLPARWGNSMTAVLEFFAITPQQPPPELLEVVAQIGAQWGRGIRSDIAAGSVGCEALARAAGAQPGINAFDPLRRRLSRPAIEGKDISDELVLRLEQVTTSPEFVAYAGQYLSLIHISEPTRPY